MSTYTCYVRDKAGRESQAQVQAMSVMDARNKALLQGFAEVCQVIAPPPPPPRSNWCGEPISNRYF